MIAAKPNFKCILDLFYLKKFKEAFEIFKG